VRSWRAAYRGQIPEDVLAGLSVPDTDRLWSERLTGKPLLTRVVVATRGAFVVGFAATGTPVNPTDRTDRSLGDLYSLYLDPDVWGRGIGTQLHGAALDGLRACGFVQAGLWVLDSNTRALRFYQRHGWTDTGRTQTDRGPGDIELLERRLQRSLIAD